MLSSRRCRGPRPRPLRLVGGRLLVAHVALHDRLDLRLDIVSSIAGLSLQGFSSAFDAGHDVLVVRLAFNELLVLGVCVPTHDHLWLLL